MIGTNQTWYTQPKIHLKYFTFPEAGPGGPGSGGFSERKYDLLEQKVNVAGVSVIASFALALGKLVAGSITGSAALFASGVHSGLDLIAALLSYSSVSQAGKPADDDHRYGHGKYENVAAVTEAILILAAVALILYRSLPAVLGGGPGVIYLETGLTVAGVSSLVSLLVHRMLTGAYRRTMSADFQSDSRHLLINGLTSAAVFLGLLAVRYTGVSAIDPALAVLVVLVLLKEGYGHLKKSAGGIFDASLSKEEEEVIRGVLAGHEGSYVQYHALRTRRAGRECHVDLHLVVPRDQIISVTHELCDSIERDVSRRLPGVHVLIHAEPCRPVSGECSHCGIDKSLGRVVEGASGCSAKPGKHGS